MFLRHVFSLRRQHYSNQSLMELNETLIHPMGLATGEWLFHYFTDISHSGQLIARLCFHCRRCVIGVE